jgi:hypothetical protein
MVPTLDANFFDAASGWRTRDIVRSEDSSCQAPLPSGQARWRQHESGAVQLIPIPFKISRIALATGRHPRQTLREPGSSELRLMER